jgi:hypothetical protein
MTRILRIDADPFRFLSALIRVIRCLQMCVQYGKRYGTGSVSDLSIDQVVK